MHHRQSPPRDESPLGRRAATADVNHTTTEGRHIAPGLTRAVTALCALACVATVLLCELPRGGGRVVSGEEYPWHTDIVATTFWVGEVFDPDAPDGSQMLSTYDSGWFESYGGCDGVVRRDGCGTERRTASNDYFPTAMTPRQNPFYLDLPYDDLNNETGFALRGHVIPWAADEPYASSVDDPDVSLMKDHWVMLRRGDRTCFGQIEDAGPGTYQDWGYVFGSDDRRPANTSFNGAGLDVSPALNGCLGFAALNGQNDTVDWRFVDEADVPPGPWTKLITR